MFYVCLPENFDEKELIPAIGLLKKAGNKIVTVSLTGERNIKSSEGNEYTADITVCDADYTFGDVVAAIYPVKGETDDCFDYDNKFVNSVDAMGTGVTAAPAPINDFGKLCEAAEFILDKEKITLNELQRALMIGFNRACDIFDSLEELGFISKKDGSKPRTVLADRAAYEKLKADNCRENNE